MLTRDNGAPRPRTGSHSRHTTSTGELRQVATMNVEEKSQQSISRRQCTCTGCGSPIEDQFILRVAPDLEWHASCLKCADCGLMLDEMRTCFVRDGKTYCKMDYFRLFGAKCARCNLGFGVADLVMRARSLVYHVTCFRCVACSRQLVPGDEFALSDEGLLCRTDHDNLILDHHQLQQQQQPAGAAVTGGLMKTSVLSPPESVNSGDDVITYGNNNNNNDSSAVGIKPSPTPAGGARSHGGHTGRSGGSRSHKSSDQKTTRIRTVLNEKQLHTLRTCYGANPRPDALMKEQLVEMTGLSPRVIRVWFQNKRCKDKKRSILMKQLQMQQQQQQPADNVDTCNGDEMWMYHKTGHSVVNPCSPVNLGESPPHQQQSTPSHIQSTPLTAHQQLIIDQYLGGGSINGHPAPPTSWQSLQPHDYDDDDELDDPDVVAARLHASNVDGLRQPTPFQQLINSFGGGGGGSTMGGCRGDSSGGGTTTSTVGETDDDTVVSFDEAMSSSIYHRGQQAIGGGNCSLQDMNVGVERNHGRSTVATPFGRHQHHQHRGLNVPA